ncbi:MAG: GNAT family N-acetyltransferase [Blautia sp.]|nr:GNAT family N-acetyltransferase [Blautia sp.]
MKCCKKSFDIEYRNVHADEAEAATAVETACFPANEACTLPIMKERVRLAPELFMTATDKDNGEMVGFITAIATDEHHLRDDFFTETSLHNPEGKYMMILSLAVLPEYQRQGIARALMEELLKGQMGTKRKAAVLTCVPANVELYKKMGFSDQGVSDSAWGGELWHEMTFSLEKSSK